MKTPAYIMIASVLFANNAMAESPDVPDEGEPGAEITSNYATEAEDNLESSDAAAINDDFEVETTDSGHCGGANFDDYGPGAPGGGNNDDYVVIHDYCADGHGVRAWAWIDGDYLGSKYNGNGLDGAAVVWDPFKEYNPDGNVLAGQSVVIQVCLVDGPNDTTGASCRQVGSVIQDG